MTRGTTAIGNGIGNDFIVECRGSQRAGVNCTDGVNAIGVKTYPSRQPRASLAGQNAKTSTTANKTPTTAKKP
jgi:hypothetical protein